MTDVPKAENHEDIIQALGFLNAAKLKLIDIAEYALAAKARDMEQELHELLGSKLKMPPKWTKVPTP